MTSDRDDGSGRRLDVPGRTREILDLAIRLAEVLFTSGAGAADTTTVMATVARVYGVRNAEPDVTHTVLTLSWSNPATNENFARSRIVRGRGTDYGRLTSASRLFTQIADGRVPLDAARHRLVRLLSAPTAGPAWLRRVGWGVVGAGTALLLGGDALVAAVAFVAALLLDAATAWLRRRGVPLFYQCLAGGVVGPLAAAGVRLVAPQSSAALIVVATIIVLLAGVTVFGGVQDTLTGFYLTGIARLAEATVATVGLAAGVIATSLVLSRGFGIRLDLTVTGPQAGNGVAATIAAAAVIVVGFAVAVRLPWRAVWAAALAAVAGEALYLLLTARDFGTVWSSACVAVLVGAAAVPLSHLSRVPVLCVVVTALVPLLPGVVLFNGLMELARASVGGLIGALTAAAVAAALAAGAILGQYLAQGVASALSPRSRRRSGARRSRVPMLAIPGRLSRIPRRTRAN